MDSCLFESDSQAVLINQLCQLRSLFSMYILAAPHDIIYKLPKFMYKCFIF